MIRKNSVLPWLPIWGVFVLFGLHLWLLHFKPDARVIAQANSQYWVRVPVSTNRGAIIDRNGIPMAVSIPAYSLFVDPKYWDPGNATKIDGLISNNALSLLEKELPGRFHWLSRKLPPPEAKPLIDLRLSGIGFLKEKERLYPQGSMLAHVLGFCDVDGNGLAGIERQWDLSLYSPPQIRFLIRDASGNLVSSVDGYNPKIQNPGTVTLTIDARFQHVLEKRLAEGLGIAKGKWGAAVCVDPRTGDILALASFPSYNPNNRESFIPENLRNNVTGRVYEPGSTFKPIAVGLALEEQWIKGDERFRGTSSIQIADAVIKNVHMKAFGWQTPEQILINSCNVGMSQIGLRFDIYRTFESLRQWGFGSPTGIELPGEEGGLLRPPDQWRGVVPANIAIGQGLAITPLQLAQAYVPLANGGDLLRLHLVKEVTSGEGAAVYKPEIECLRQVLSKDTAFWLRKALRKVVTEGTGKVASTPLAEVAGKTGTAQVAEKGLYSENRYVASFAGMWPWQKPEFVLVVVVGEPAGNLTYGGQIAAPIFRNVVEDIYRLHFAEKDNRKGISNGL